MSSSSCWTIIAIHEGMVATRSARRPSGIDFSCGFQSLRPSGVASRTRRVRGASLSSWARSRSAIFMRGLPAAASGRPRDADDRAGEAPIATCGGHASRSLRLKESPLDLAAIAVCTLAWGTTWYAVTLQLGVVDPSVSLVYRFALASLLLFLWCALRREPVALGRRQHAAAAGLGLFAFTVSYAVTYEAETRVVSAVVAVLFAALAFVNLVVFRVLLGQRARRSAWGAAALGAAGVALLSWGEIVQAGRSMKPAQGIVLSLIGVVASAVGNVFARRGEEAGAPIAASTAWATLYGTLFLALWVLAAGRTWRFEPSRRYVLSLLYLASIGSVVAFLLFFRVARSRGYTVASYIFALTPILAMAMSTLFEGKSWNVLGLGGVAVVLAGQWLLLRT